MVECSLADLKVAEFKSKPGQTNPVGKIAEEVVCRSVFLIGECQ